MKKIYTITFQKVLNNGAALQAYALAKFLKDSSYNVEVIDYLPRYFLLQTYRPAKGISKSIDKLKKIISFSRFNSRYLPLTRKLYLTGNSLKNIRDAHAVVCGSDQVWNPHLTNGKIDSAFFLDFASVNTRRIAYAASAGSSRLLDSRDTAAPLLRKLHAIGVREDILASDISTITPELHAEVVVDPSLLIRDYSEVENHSRVPKHDFLVTYVVGSGQTLDIFNSYIEKLKKIVNLPVYHIGAKAIAAADVNILDIGPDEWVAFFHAAKFVGTNSFHGTAFSVNFEKEFLFFPHTVENLNARQKTLLSRIDLMDRMISKPEDLENYCIKPINYTEATPKLDSIINSSKKFLLSALEQQP